MPVRVTTRRDKPTNNKRSLDSNHDPKSNKTPVRRAKGGLKTTGLDDEGSTAFVSPVSYENRAQSPHVPFETGDKSHDDDEVIYDADTIIHTDVSMAEESIDTEHHHNVGILFQQEEHSQQQHPNENQYQSIEYPLAIPPIYKLEIAEGSRNGIYLSRKKKKINRLISCDVVSTEEYLQDPDDQFLLGMMVSLKVCDKSTPTIAYSQKGGGGSTIHNKNYDRIAIFADLVNAGRCFGIMMIAAKKASDVFEYALSQGHGVGDIFLMPSVGHTTNVLGPKGNGVLLINGEKAIIPIVNAIRYVPTKGLTIPRAINETCYFCYHQYTNLACSQISICQATCSGTTCDRQIDASTEKFNCGCFYTETVQPGFTMTMNITIPCETNMNITGRIVVKTFRSYRILQVFTYGKTMRHWHKSVKLSEQFAEKAKRIIRYVNKHGGWTVIGWIKNGQQADVSSDSKNKQDTITSRRTSPHVVYLMPSHLEVLENDELKTYQYKVPTKSPENSGEDEDSTEESDNENGD